MRMFFPSSNTKPAEKNKKAARILLPAARTASEHLNRRTVRLLLVFTVLSLLLCRLICVLLIPRCEPTLIMHPCYQEHLAQRLKAHHDCHMVFRPVTEFRNDQSLFVGFAGTAVGNKQKICFVGRYQLRHAGKAFSVRPCPADGSKLFGRCAAKTLIQRRIIAVFLFALQHIPQLTAIQLSAQLQKLIHSNIDMDIVRLALTCRAINIVGCESEMNSS